MRISDWSSDVCSSDLYGWRYKGRTLRNRLPDIFKFEIFRHQYPRYVWVTEFSLPDDLRGFDQCQRKVRAHVVVDATGSKFGESMQIGRASCRERVCQYV